MKKLLLLILALLLCMSFASCTPNEPVEEEKDDPSLPSESEVNGEEEPVEPEQAEQEPEKEPNLYPEHLLDFGDGLEYLPADKESKLEVSASHLTDETVIALFSPKIEGYIDINQKSIQHLLIIMMGSGREGEVYNSFGEPYDKDKLLYTNWMREIDEPDKYEIYLKANTCAQIAYEVFGFENFKIEEGYLGFTLNGETGEYYTTGGFSPSASFASYEHRIARPDEKTIAVRFVISNALAWMGEEGWNYIGEGKITFEIMQNEKGEDFLRYKNFEYLPYETPIAP